MIKALVVCGSFVKNNKNKSLSSYETLKIFGTYKSTYPEYKSGFMDKLFKGIDFDLSMFNGGFIDDLEDIMYNISEFNVVFWFPNIDNDEEKLLPKIKKKNPKCILVSSKNNTQNKYSREDLVARMLEVKANLCLEITNEAPEYSSVGKYVITLHDPLGNIFINEEQNIDKIKGVLVKRVKELISATRIGSVSISDMIIAPDEPEFFNYVKDYAKEFHNLIHAANSNRLLGNASFRCERGFPSFRSFDLIFVSCRNIDKRLIDRENFVAVNPRIKDGKVEYYGDVKPSVDTPIQVKLYQYYNKAKYMLHSHVYIENAPFTKNVIPCGAIEEFDDITDIFPDKELSTIMINLKGHGSLVITDNVDNLKDIKYISRNMPEII